MAEMTREEAVQVVKEYHDTVQALFLLIAHKSLILGTVGDQVEKALGLESVLFNTLAEVKLFDVSSAYLAVLTNAVKGQLGAGKVAAPVVKDDFGFGDGEIILDA